MATDCHLHVCIPAYSNDEIAVIARRHLESFGPKMLAPCRRFLQALSFRSGENPGSKGGLSLWGEVGNHTNGEAFCDDLLDFWADILKSNDDGTPDADEHIIVFYEKEQTEAATAFEIYLLEAEDAPNSPITIKRHSDLPFTWMQF